MRMTVEPDAQCDQGRCGDLCSACEASALLRRLPGRFEFSKIRHRCGHGVDGARRYPDGSAAGAEAEAAMGIPDDDDNEMAELLDDVADSRCSTCLERAGFEPPGIEL